MQRAFVKCYLHTVYKHGETPMGLQNWEEPICWLSEALCLHLFHAQPIRNSFYVNISVQAYQSGLAFFLPPAFLIYKIVFFLFKCAHSFFRYWPAYHSVTSYFTPVSAPCIYRIYSCNEHTFFPGKRKHSWGVRLLCGVNYMNFFFRPSKTSNAYNRRHCDPW